MVAHCRGTWLGVSIVAVVCVVTAAVAAGCSSGPTRSVGSFCSTYFAQKQAFLQRFDVSANRNESFGQAIGGMATGLASLGEIPVIFDRLDKVAPTDIEPDVAAVRDSFKKELDLAGGAISNPLGALAAGFVTSLVSAGPFRKVSDYVTANCHSS
jgi:hypothetical protein